MDNPEIFTDVIIQYCDFVSLGKLARTCRIYYSIIEKAPIYREITQYWNKPDIFMYSCKHGLLYVAKWKYQQDKLGINITHALEKACGCDQLKVAQWLHSLGADNRARCDAFFELACRIGSIMVNGNTSRCLRISQKNKFF
jgi:hypothetical protein